MEEKKFQSIQMEVKYSNFKVLNPDFTRCRCNVFYTGRNRNYTDITPNALQKLLTRKGYANIPVIGHIKKAENSSDMSVMGGHDRKIEISDDGVESINQCVPYGVIPEDCNPAMDKIIDIHGEEKEYFSVDVILWTSYFPEIMETIGDPNVLFSQSMEILTNEGFYDGDYYVIDDFSLQALCLLGKYNAGDPRHNQSTEPCFEDSTVHRFSINETKFKQNFELMLEKLKSYDTGDKSVQDNNNFEKEDKTVMDKTKLIEALATFTYENALGETVGKYALIDIAENSVGLIDRQDNKAYSINFVETDGEIVFDFDNAVECSFTTKEKVEDDFNYANEITMASEVSAKAKENEFPERIAVQMQKELEKFTTQIDEMTNAYNELKKQYDLSAEKLAQYEAADAKRKAEEHKAEVEALYEEFAKKINRVPEFLVYRADEKNIEKDIETIKAELTVIAGKAAMSKSQAFSYTPTVSGIKEFKESNELAYTDRYGNLFAKFMK